MPGKQKVATTPVDSSADYKTGVPRHHHNLYLEDGNFVIQAENAIFKIHRYFLSKYSTVLRDMLDTPQDDQNKDGTDEKPLVLAGDNASSWEHLLEAIYESHSLGDSNSPSGEIMLSILSIAHKYCMETIETSIMNRLKQASTTAAYVDLMVASRIVDSEPLHQHALKGLVSSRPKPDLVQAMRIGVAPYHTVMTAALQASDATMMASYKTAEQLGRELMVVKKKLANAKSQLAELTEAEETSMSMRFGPH